MYQMQLSKRAISGVVPCGRKLATIVIDDVTIKTFLTPSRAEVEFQSTDRYFTYLRCLCSLFVQRMPSSLNSFPGKKIN